MTNLRPYQIDCINNTRAILARLAPHERRVVVQMATGAGKTYTAAELISSAELKGKRTLFVCDTLELVQQALLAFDNYGLSVGVMQAQHARTNPQKLTQVCSQATLSGWLKSNRFDNYQVDLIIHDEAHCQFKVRESLSEKYPNAPVLGLTATPFAKGMGDFYNAIVSAVSMQRLIDDGYLSDYAVYAPSQPSMKGTTLSGGDYKASAAAEKYDNALVADIVQTWLKHGKGRRTLMFACNVAHSKHLVAEFVAAGVNAIHVDGYPDEPDAVEDRFQKINRYRNGEIEILSSVALTTKGFDAPETSCLIVARPTKSLSLHWQILGRVLRTAENKTDAIVLDHAGNTLRHGFPTDITSFELDDSSKPEIKADKREKGERLPVPCTSCSYMKPPGVHACPNCQFAPEKEHGVVNVDGELVEVKAKPEPSRDDMQRFYSELIGAGKNEKACMAIFKRKYKQWPNGLDSKPLPPSDATKRYITSSNIAYARGRKANAA